MNINEIVATLEDIMDRLAWLEQRLDALETK